ncbi:MAG: response regulator transcription factor [Pseudomonadota bacterium]|jgi:DNA-binding NarL/FixJ family response regulator
MIGILIVDDHPSVREGVRHFLEKTVDLRIRSEAATAAEALRLVQSQPHDLVLLDINLPDADGRAVLREIRALQPNLPVLMFSSTPEEDCAVDCLKAGAAGYLTKDAPPDDMRHAIRRAAAGGHYVGPGLAKLLLSENAICPTPPPHRKLSPRELDIMLRISRGQSLTVIANVLHLSVKTVSTHRANILHKMEMTSNADLTRYVVTHRLDTHA